MWSLLPRRFVIAEPQWGADRALMLLHFRVRDRPAIASLWGIDEAMANVVRTGSSQPALAAIKLAWWREALERLDQGPAPAEPRLQAVAHELLPLGIKGEDLAALEPGWMELLQEQPDPDVVASRGRALLTLTARILGANDSRIPDAGALVAVTDAIRMGHDGLLEARQAILSKQHGRVNRRARPVTLAARLAARDPLEAQGTPGRALALIAHRLSGIIAPAD